MFSEADESVIQVLSILHWLLVLLFAGGLVYAMGSDLFHRLLSNRLTLALALLFLPAALVSGVDWRAILLDHGGTGLAVLAVGMAAFARGWLGGGDVKLLAAVSLWAGSGLVLPILAGTALLGGLLAGVVLIAHRWRGTSREVPYGIAIAAATLWTLPRFDTAPAQLAALFP